MAAILSWPQCVKIVLISFRMLYHFTWNLKANLNIVSNLDLNLISNKNDNHRHNIPTV